MELRQSTEIKVRIGPFLDATDGKTPETGITLGAADQAEILKANGIATVDISGATWAAVTGCDGWYDLTITTSYSNTLGHLTVVVQDESECLPVFGEFEVVTVNYWDSKYSTDVLQVDVTQWLGTAAATPTVAGVPEVDTTHISGTAQTANDNGADINDILDDTAEIGLAGAGLTDLGGMSSGMQTEINNQVVDVIRTDTTSEMSQGAPPVDPTLEEMLAYPYFQMRNKRVVSETEDATYDDAGTTKLYKSAIEEVSDVFTKSESVSGA